MALNRTKQFTIKNGEFLGDISAWQSGYAGGMPCKINTAGNVARAFSDVGFIGIFAKGSDVDASGSAVTFYAGPGLFTLEKGATEAAFPYDSAQTYTAGDNIGIVGGVWSNNSPANVRGRVMGVGAVSGGTTTSLTLLFVNP